MAEERKRDYSFEILGAAVLLLLLVLLCYFHVICPLPTCPEGLVSCNNCPGNCCLPDGSCPCPQGSAPCSIYCPSTLNCPSGCCNINTCACTATPQCPPNTIWSEARGCCLYTIGPSSGECADVCNTDRNRFACSLPGVDSCGLDGCCPKGSLGWDNNQKCCIDSLGQCMLTCLIDSSRTGCPNPGMGGCEATGCCPKDTYWDSSAQCCMTESGFCVNDPCANVKCPDGEICVNGECKSTQNLCAGKTCPEGFICDPQTGACIEDPCKTMTCPSGQMCVNGQCINDPCAEVNCPAGQTCLDGVCENLCANIQCPAGAECNPETGVCEYPTICSSDVQCQVCGANGYCGGVEGSRSCTSDDDCSSAVCDTNGKCDGSNGGNGGGNSPFTVNCNYQGTVGSCLADIICSGGCVNEIKCVDLRLPSDQCKGVGVQCTNSSECCCGYSCQVVNGQGVCCPGGLWQCGYENVD